MVDGLAATRVERPETAEQLAEVLRAAADAGEAVMPVGGGRALGLGDPPERLDVRLETRGLRRVLELSQADMTASAEAGITIEELNAELAPLGQFVPIDPFNSPGHTIGGILAAGLSGPLRLRYGSPRDFVIGLRVALPDGRLASSGGRVVKNVSGYDLNKLHQGALGSLGVIVAASFKVYPRPLSEMTLETTAEDVWSVAERALRLRLTPVALEVTHEGRLLARLAGTRDGVARIASELGWAEVDGAVWEAHSRQPERAQAETWARISVPPAKLAGVVRRVRQPARWWASPGVGTAHVVGEMDAEAVRLLRLAAERAGGSLVLFDAPLTLKRQVGTWGTPPTTLTWMRQLRDAFDPGRTLSPGRYLT